jgi:hypothetical protein
MSGLVCERKLHRSQSDENRPSGRTVPVGPDRPEGLRVAEYLRAACAAGTNATVGEWRQVAAAVMGLPVLSRD